MFAPDAPDAPGEADVDPERAPIRLAAHRRWVNS